MKLQLVTLVCALATAVSATPVMAGSDASSNQHVLTEEPYEIVVDNDNNDLDVYAIKPPSFHAKKPMIDSETLQELILEANLEKHATEFYKNANSSIKQYGHPTRVISSKGHYKTLGYILHTLKSLKGYYNVTMQPLKATYGRVFEYNLTIAGEIVPTEYLQLTPPTKYNMPATGPLVNVANYGCALSDYAGFPVGGIALISRGECTFDDKAKLAGISGALAAVYYDNIDEDTIPRSTLGDYAKIQAPSLMISKADGLKYRDMISSGKVVQATALIRGYVSAQKTFNVIAETVVGDKDNVVMLGGHSDSVEAGPGINDDGSGSISLLEIAVQLSNYTVNNTVRFAWWAAEEEGLIGSSYYASTLAPEENAKIRLFMDYDMLASPNYGYQVYDANNKENPAGSEELKQLYLDYYVDHGYNYTLVPFDGRSDYVGFITHGIPGGGIATGAEGIKTPEEVDMFGGVAGEQYDPCYHEICDDLTNLDYEAWLVNTQLVAHSVATYARSLEGFPARVIDNSTVATTETETETEAFARKMIYRGSRLIL